MYRHLFRTSLATGSWALRLNYVHQFLGKEVKNYGDECCGVFPPKQIQLAVPKGDSLSVQWIRGKVFLR